MYEKSYIIVSLAIDLYNMSKRSTLCKSLYNKRSPMKLFSKLFRLLSVVLVLAPYLTPSAFAADKIKKPLQGHLQNKGNLNRPSNIKMSNPQSTGPNNIKYGSAKASKPSNTKAGNPYSIYKPYNPNNPPPINKILPVSSNAH